MTDLTKLNVSLTKHGAHKIAVLLREHDKDHLLENVWGKVNGVNIDEAQAAKNLSANRAGVVPDVWDEVRPLGNEAINALVFVAIIFSHHELIAAMQKSTDRKPFKGTIDRDTLLVGKAYTNFAHTVHELGYSSENLYTDHVRFDVKKLFDIPNLHPLVTKILTLKLETAKWDKTNSLLDEVSRQKFHDVFSISQDQFVRWLSTGSLDESAAESSGMSSGDLDFFTDNAATSAPGPFIVAPGHKDKKTGKVEVAAPKGRVVVDLLHNEIQNKFVRYLKGKYVDSTVRSEAPTDHGTSIDVVLMRPTENWFYEIKTAGTVKACIRQAIPQLLEYAYWPGDVKRATRLVIVSQWPLTKDAERYLQFLSKAFGLPLEYEQFDPKGNE